MNEKTKALKAAFPHTIPVLTGFTFLGIAYGILMSTHGYGTGWAVLMSAMAFAGSMQYVAITALTTAFNPISVFLLTLMVNARHLFYGISMLGKYKNTGKMKPYLIFALCDETFSIVCSAEPPEGVDRNWFMFFITLLDYIYWVAGSAIGGLLGSMATFNTEGLDFVLTALFVVIFVGQWKSRKNRKSAVIGVVCSALCLAIFGSDNFIIPSMVAIILALTVFRRKVEVKEEIVEEIECI